jgi:hypothetical protein
MIISCDEVVNLNYVVINVALTLSEQLLCNRRMALMRTIMPLARLGKVPYHLEVATCLQLRIN